MASEDAIELSRRQLLVECLAQKPVLEARLLNNYARQLNGRDSLVDEMRLTFAAHLRVYPPQTDDSRTPLSLAGIWGHPTLIWGFPRSPFF
jgi:hypothetical protein